ncbi:hypothetical protein NECAME_14991 [Necator americanus]|uniref:Secreted protein n=1 Tax=Necator americanus TaxID=51031 RepID=W2SK68_NECAM|nr:hypothetical protein NECAME_14991 [Necator americanus]ETN69948.1 hypothetical protein NECAME_14991 [Necator americanus]
MFALLRLMFIAAIVNGVAAHLFGNHVFHHKCKVCGFLEKYYRKRTFPATEVRNKRFVPRPPRPTRHPPPPFRPRWTLPPYNPRCHNITLAL